MSADSQSARTERIATDLTGVLAPLGLVVEDITVMPAGKRRLVRVLVDREFPADADPTAPVPPLDLDQIADATRAVSDRLDETDAMGEQPYVLEVSSPGTDRPLTQPRHFRRNVGRLVEVTADGAEPVTGRITRADDTGITLAVPGQKGGAASEQVRTYDEGLRGAVQVEWNRSDDAPASGEGDDD
ncbi:ribosome maturation factor RimP [Flexivirga sp. ID2601S]|uniref:Ribosome maturation factor RimP n=1 Tax=Flexivirga aerilata TaxID=1656889 RepID=A0A849AKN3_9MICO|nr:ribosome maturation factor RimP [Flexivirga aerilata]NNG40377.1 ribosome maturation factor RimP [Flexivirga aerilata]